MPKGEVTYEIRGDDSYLEKDLERAQKRVEESDKDMGARTERITEQTEESVRQEKEETTRHHEEQNDERQRDDEETGRKREETERRVSEKIKDIAADTVKVIGASMLAVGAGAAAVGGMAVNSANDLDKAMNMLSASTGLTRKQTEHYQKVLEDVYKNNYGDSFEDIAQAMVVMEQYSISDMVGDMDELQRAVESGYALRDTFGYEIPESTRAASTMMKQFGVTADEAYDLIAWGAQNGLDYSGELLDSINEYSVQFSKVGMDAEDMFRIFDRGVDSGAFNLDKIGDAVKEFSIRAIDGSDSTAEGFQLLGLNADEMAAKFAAGGESAKAAFQQTVEALAAMEDPLAQNVAGVDLFGTMWEDLGPEAVAALADITGGVDEAAGAMESLKEVRYDDLGSMFEGLKRNVEAMLIPLGEELTPILNDLLNSTLPMMEEALPPLIDLVGQAVAQAAPVVEQLLPVMLDLFMQLLPVFTSIISDLLPVLIELFSAVAPVLGELVGAVLPILVELFQALIPPVMEIVGALLPPLLELIQALLPVFSMLIELLGPVIDAFISLLNPMVSLITNGITPLVSAIVGLMSAALEPLKALIGIVASIWAEKWSGIMRDTQSVIGNVKGIIDGLVNFVKGVFTGNWRQAWNGVVQIFSNIFGGIANLAKTPINGIIDKINGFLSGLNGIKIPDWVPGVGGMGFSIPMIPRLKKGIKFVPSDYYPAYLDYGERVLTQAENARYTALGGLEGIERTLSDGNDFLRQEAWGRGGNATESTMKVILEKGSITGDVAMDGVKVGQLVAPTVDVEINQARRESER